MTVNIKFCAARPWNERRQTVSKFRNTVSMKITVANITRCNIAVHYDKIKTVCHRRGVDELKSF